MLRKSKSPVQFDFTRSGGTIISAQIDVWSSAIDDWKLEAQISFNDVTAKSESSTATLAKGNYVGVFQCFVQESLNGRYEFELSVAQKPTFKDDGDVNTTPSQDDSKVFKDQFFLVIQ